MKSTINKLAINGENTNTFNHISKGAICHHKEYFEFQSELVQHCIYHALQERICQDSFRLKINGEQWNMSLDRIPGKYISSNIFKVCMVR